LGTQHFTTTARTSQRQTKHSLFVKTSHIIASQLASIRLNTTRNQIRFQPKHFVQPARFKSEAFAGTVHSEFIETNPIGSLGTQGDTMKNLKSLGLITALALSLTTAAFAKPTDLQTFDGKGATAQPTATFTTQGFSSTNKSQESNLDVYIPGWSLGAIGFDVNGSNLKIVDVKGAPGITVSLKDASGGATNDRLKFVVNAAANTPKGVYVLQVMLENKKFGDQGRILITAEVK
jgi:hypothetical protein